MLLGEPWGPAVSRLRKHTCTLYVEISPQWKPFNRCEFPAKSHLTAYGRGLPFCVHDMTFGFQQKPSLSGLHPGGLGFENFLQYAAHIVLVFPLGIVRLELSDV